MNSFRTLHRVVVVRDREGNDHVQTYSCTQYDTVDAAVEHMGHSEALRLLNRTCADRERDAAKSALEYDLRNPQA